MALWDKWQLWKALEAFLADLLIEEWHAAGQPKPAGLDAAVMGRLTELTPADRSHLHKIQARHAGRHGDDAAGTEVTDVAHQAIAMWRCALERERGNLMTKLDGLVAELAEDPDAASKLPGSLRNQLIAAARRGASRNGPPVVDGLTSQVFRVWPTLVRFSKEVMPDKPMTAPERCRAEHFEQIAQWVRAKYPNDQNIPRTARTVGEYFGRLCSCCRGQRASFDDDPPGEAAPLDPEERMQHALALMLTAGGDAVKAKLHDGMAGYRQARNKLSTWERLLLAIVQGGNPIHLNAATQRDYPDLVDPWPPLHNTIVNALKRLNKSPAEYQADLDRMRQWEDAQRQQLLALFQQSPSKDAGHE